MKNYKDVYMLTVIYKHGKAIDIEFNSKEDRSDFVMSIQPAIDSDICDIKLTLWEMMREVA